MKVSILEFVEQEWDQEFELWLDGFELQLVAADHA